MVNDDELEVEAQPETWPQIAAAILACIGLVIGCFYVLHLIPL